MTEINNLRTPFTCRQHIMKCVGEVYEVIRQLRNGIWKVSIMNTQFLDDKPHHKVIQCKYSTDLDKENIF